MPRQEQCLISDNQTQQNDGVLAFFPMSGLGHSARLLQWKGAAYSIGPVAISKDRDARWAGSLPIPEASRPAAAFFPAVARSDRCFASCNGMPRREMVTTGIQCPLSDILDLDQSETDASLRG